MIFARFVAIYGNRFEIQQQSPEQSARSKREWALSILENQLSMADIERAIDRCKQELAWPPSIAEFLERCLPSHQQLGVPSAAEAFAQLINNRRHSSEVDWLHAIVFESGRRLGFNRLQQEAESRLWPEFQRLYKQCCHELHQGQQFELPQKKARLADNSALSGFVLINQLIEQQQLKTELGHQLYFYLTLDQGSHKRSSLREAAMKQAQALQLKLEFPD